MRIGILGAGLSGLSLAYVLQGAREADEIELLEKEASPGGLCRSFAFGNIHYDIGPHILFSKDSEVLSLMLGLLGENVHKLRRSNKVFHDGRFVKYPFENELSALSARDRDYCLNTFLSNPYADYAPRDMLQFFLATFGEGITNLYLRPYNEKIWKFDPAMMDTQMVERIPKPPAQDIVASARGIATEGYVHQLWFHYPRRGGIQSLVDAFMRQIGPPVAVRCNTEIVGVTKAGKHWTVSASDGTTYDYDLLVSTIPAPKLIGALGPGVPLDVVHAARQLKSNSILLCNLRLRRDRLDGKFAVMVADRSVLFHRLSRLNFLLPPGSEDGTTYLQAEITYRKGDLIDLAEDREIRDRVVCDLCRLGFMEAPEDVVADEVARFPFAYVIYDLDHRQNMERVRRCCEKELGLWLHGRFGEFEYLNMDAVIRRSIDKCRGLVERLTGRGKATRSPA